MRVCVVTHSGYPVEPRARRMAEALAGQGHAVDVLCLRLAGQAEEETLDGVRVTRLPVTRHQGAGASVYLREYASFFVRAATALRRRHRRERYAVVQVHNPPDALAFCTLPLKLARVPLLLDLRELMPELFMSRFGLARRSAVVRILTWLERWACGYADAVLTVHERHRQIMIGRGVAAEKLYPVLNVPDERIFDPARWSGGRPRRPDEFVVMYHGSVLERLGADLLAQAAARVRPEIPGLRVEVYGTGDFLPVVEQLVAGLGLGDVVRLHGMQPLERIPAAIAEADVGVVPMRQDAFTDCVLPTKLLEYAALGVPAIASRTLATTDYFADDMVQYVAPGDVQDLADKLLVLYRNPAMAQAMAERARRFTAAHNWPEERAAYLRLVARTAGGRE